MFSANSTFDDKARDSKHRIQRASLSTSSLSGCQTLFTICCLYQPGVEGEFLIFLTCKVAMTTANLMLGLSTSGLRTLTFSGCSARQNNISHYIEYLWVLISLDLLSRFSNNRGDARRYLPRSSLRNSPKFPVSPQPRSRRLRGMHVCEEDRSWHLLPILTAALVRASET